MDKNTRYNYYKHLQGLGVWDMGPTNPELRSFVVNDGPLGVRKPSVDSFSNQAGVMKSVCLIAPSALAASFDKKLAYRNGELLAQDCLSKKTDVLLAPGINIKRSALCGRNFEYFSEDPYLTGILASEYIKGLEENGVGSCVKHYLANNKEHGRLINDSIMSLEALNNIYLRNFYYVMKYGHPSTIMTSYNLVNGEYVSESDYLLQKKLRKDFKFNGLIMSDWCAINNKAKSIKAGINVEMPISKRSFESIDRNYGVLFDDNDLIQRDKEIEKVAAKFQKHYECTDYDFNKIHEEEINLACETFVLLKNDDGILPFSKNDKFIVVGKTAKNPVFQGGGSAEINTYKSISFIDALKEKNIENVYFEEANKREDEISQYYKKGYKVVLLLSRPIALDSENMDRTTLDLEKNQIDLFNSLKKMNIDFVSIIETGSVVNISEIYKYSKAVLLTYRAGEGQEEGLVRTLIGENNPSGKLPETWISSLDDNIIYQDLNRRDPYFTYYDDDIYVGYRYYDLKEPKHFYLPFGYGLSYSRFNYSNFSLRKTPDKLFFSVEVENVSDNDGKNTILIFSSKINSSIYRAKKDLVGFNKIHLKKHESKKMIIEVNIEDLSVYDRNEDDYKVEDGEYCFSFATDSKTLLHTINTKIDGKFIKENRNMEKLPRKTLPKKISINSPIELLFSSETFLKLSKKYGMNFTLDEFSKNYAGMSVEPLRSLTYRDELNIDFEFLNELIELLNRE